MALHSLSKRECISKIIILTFNASEEVVRPVIEGHVIGFCLAYGQSSLSPLVKEITQECLNRMQPTKFIDVVYDDVDKFFTYEELMELHSILSTNVMKKFYKTSTLNINPFKNIFYYLYKISKECSQEILLNKERCITQEMKEYLNTS